LPAQAAEPRPKYYIKGRLVKVLTERVQYLDENGPQARAVLKALLAKYQDEGMVGGLDNVKLLEIPPSTKIFDRMPLETGLCA
jgi:hypothetical protein